MLGRELVNLLAVNGVPFLGTDIECDITDSGALVNYAERHRPDVVVNTAAYTAVDRAEDEPERAWLLNAQGAANVATAAAAVGARIVHISTDYVFDGVADVPYNEEEKPNPINVYGATKAEGERLVCEIVPQAVVLRTAWLYGRGGRNFVETMLGLMSRCEEIRVVDDQHGTPTSAATLSGIILALIAGYPAAAGVFHVTDGGATTWCGFAEAIAEEGVRLGLLERECRVVPCTTADYPTRARRPAYGVLDKTKIELLLETGLVPWREALVDYLKKRGRVC
ncbi:MAG: dTDP-4-dehydrorhamnose reductase [Lentisphaerae bacterium]|jgi:dTDP-4-dehydrorhamnose reductase|nr:dTDP-4-dehydrorhamnose reductase [Lentisphaerota bacterium]